MKNIARLFIAPWYLLGWLSPVYLAINNPELYRNFGTTALIPSLRDLWQSVVMPHIVLFALILALFELSVGLLLIGKGNQVKYAVIASILFNSFLVVLGLSGQSTGWLSDFLMNRLPNVIFIAIQIPLIFTIFEQSLAEAISSFFRRTVHA
jgi:hypothetical protein